MKTLTLLVLLPKNERLLKIRTNKAFFYEFGIITIRFSETKDTDIVND